MALAETFMEEYGDCIDQGDECLVPDIDGDDVWYAFIHAKASAAGLDSWEPAEIKLFSKSACHYVARLYNMIERGCAWPVSSTVAKAAFLPKDGAEEGEVMSNRLLLIMTVLYRKWAAIRLVSLGRWIDRWATSEMYAGVAAMGAEDAWHLTCMEMEELSLEGTGFCGGTADIMKFFDQIPRELVYRPSRFARGYLWTRPSL